MTYTIRVSIVILLGLFTCTIGMGCASLMTETQADSNTMHIATLRDDMVKHKHREPWTHRELNDAILRLSTELHEMKQEVMRLNKFRGKHSQRWPDLE